MCDDKKETYDEFTGRFLKYESLPPEELYNCFKPNDSVFDKVDDNGDFKPFFGDTVVFDIDNEAKRIIGGYIDELYETAGECLAQRLKTETMHITLHDLSSSSELSAVSAESCSNKERLLSSIKNEPLKLESIIMESTYVFNCNSSSIVLGFKPKNDAEYKKLIALYYRIDKIKKLNYKLTPHITLAYYKNGGYDYGKVQKMINAVKALNKRGVMEIVLSTDRLFYQSFSDMNSYTNVFSLLNPQGII